MVFVQRFCMTLADKSGTYYILCGRAPFLWNVGVRSVEVIFTWPGEFIRIHLNPIRESDIEVILDRTTKDGRTLKDIIASNNMQTDLTAFIGQLYVLTGGHPRTLLRSLLTHNPLEKAEAPYPILVEVRKALEMYPHIIARLFRDRNDIMDLSQRQWVDGKVVSLEYFAARIHAGYDLDTDKTRLFIPPPIERYLMWYLLPFSDFVLSIGTMICDRRFIDKARLYEEALIKWFHSVLHAGGNMIGEVMKGFVPINSILYNQSWSLDPKKIEQGPHILWNPSQMYPDTVYIRNLSEDLSDYLSSKEIDVFYPAACSKSPDIFLIPNSKQSGILIGLQSKCYSDQRRDETSKAPPKLSRADIIKGADNMYSILELVRKVRPHRKVQGVFIMCGTCDYSGMNIQDSSSILFEGDRRYEDFESIIMNLSSPSQRRRFVKVAMGESHYSAVSDVATAFELIVNYRHDLNEKHEGPQCVS